MEFKIQDQAVEVGHDFEMLYRSTFSAVAKLVRRWNGSLQDAKDVFHDALVVFVEKEQEGELHVRSSREAYLIGICKHLWIKKFSKDVEKISFDDMERSIEIPEDFYPTVNTQGLLAFIASTGRRCLDLLQAVYFRRLSIGVLARELGYGSEHSLSVQKYKCLEKVREQIRSKMVSYEDFLE